MPFSNDSVSERRVAIVIGGSRGIGRSVVRRLAADGFAVVVNYAQNKAEADAAVEDAGGEAYPAQADVADEVEVAAMFDQAERTWGGVDVVVHCAGRLALGPLVDLDLNVLDDCIAPISAARSSSINKRQADCARAVNLSTSVVGLAFPNYSAYSASKGAVQALSLILARELRSRDVTVNAVAPGPTATELILQGRDQATLDRLATAVPLERLGTPTDMAEVIAFLASPAGHWVNGQTVRANGGVI